MSDPRSLDEKPIWKEPAALLALALIGLRLFYLGIPDLFPEEAYYWNYARHLDIGYLDHPPMVAWLIHLGTSLFGENEFGIRFGTFVCSLITATFTFLLARQLYDRRTGIMAVLVVQVLPFYFISGVMMTPDAPLTACWAGFLYFFSRVLFAGRGSAWLGVGICLGLGMLSKYTIALLGPATLLFLALDPPSRVWFRRIAPYASVLFSIVLFSPVIVWNATHEWASFAFQSTGRTAEPTRFSLHEFLGAVLLLLTPVGVFLAGRSLVRTVPPSTTEPWDAAVRRRLFVRVFTLVPLVVFFGFSLVHRVKLNWTGPLWLAVIPIIAAQLMAMAAFGSIVSRAWSVTVAFFSLAYLGILHHVAFGIPGLGYQKNIELLPVGWKEFGRELEEEKRALRAAHPGRLLIVGLDRNFIASEAAFYQSDRAEAVRETTGAHLFGSLSLMYEFWFPAPEQDGATILLVSFTESDLDKHRIRERCRTLGPVAEHWLQRDGIKIRPYYTRVGTDYRHDGYPD